MTRRFGIDTSILVRLVTGHPEQDFDDCVLGLRMLADKGDEIFASNEVIGEAYVAVQHHYGVTGTDARAALLATLRSGLVAPLNGRSTLSALTDSGGAGVFDRLIANGYAREGLEVLTLDRKMAHLANVRRL